MQSLVYSNFLNSIKSEFTRNWSRSKLSRLSYCSCSICTDQRYEEITNFSPSILHSIRNNNSLIVMFGYRSIRRRIRFAWSVLFCIVRLNNGWRTGCILFLVALISSISLVRTAWSLLSGITHCTIARRNPSLAYNDWITYVRGSGPLTVYPQWKADTGIARLYIVTCKWRLRMYSYI